ncbi:MAG: glycosyltransferase family 4 protein [Desulfobulbaceae bacterium]|nr:glycosyltransferase family 4 protein [Desulfobulbaceae bacterium]
MFPQMRILLDFQGCQTGSKERGIGRYTKALGKAMIEHAGNHEIHIALNSQFYKTLPPLCDEFEKLVGRKNIHIWQSLADVDGIKGKYGWRRRAAEKIREDFIASLRPDVVHICSLFEGMEDCAVTSVPSDRSYVTAVTLYDLIPFFNKKKYLRGSGRKKWYYEKINHLKQADLLLAISNYSRQEAIDALQLQPDSAINIAGDADAQFRPIDIPQKQKESLFHRLGIRSDFILYSSVFEPRKNMEGLITAYASFPEPLRRQHQLVITGPIGEIGYIQLESHIASLQLQPHEVIIAGYVSDEELICLYNLCKLYVFPSFYEGFGLPALEAMRCGAPVIGSNTSSIPEIIGCREALFDPHSPQDMAQKISRCLSDNAFLDKLQKENRVQAGKFSWEKSAKTALHHFELLHDARQSGRRSHLQTATPSKKIRLALFASRASAATPLFAACVSQLEKDHEIFLFSDPAREAADNNGVLSSGSHSVSYFLAAPFSYDRIIYFLQDRERDGFMVECLEHYPGTVFVDGCDAGVLPIVKEHLFYALGYPVLTNGEMDQDIKAGLNWFVDHAVGLVFLRQAPVPSSCPHPFVRSAVPDKCVESFDFYYQNHPLVKRQKLLKKIVSQHASSALEEIDLLQTADVISCNFPIPKEKQLLIDISELVRQDQRTGIQRVVRSILNYFLLHPPAGYRVEPIYRQGSIYRYARKFTTGYLGLQNIGLVDDGIELRRDDIFLALDLDLDITPQTKNFWVVQRQLGVKIYYIIYDLLPELHPEWFAPDFASLFYGWLKHIAHVADGLIAISRAVADEYHQWFQQEQIHRNCPLQLGFFHLGSDIQSSSPTTGFPDKAEYVFSLMEKSVTFLMVGTVEPRKGHDQVLSAFEHLWAAGYDILLVIIGKAGWLSDETVKRILRHNEEGRRLFWFEKASDEFLLRLYAKSTALILASQGEGFGLPIIEAARHNIPVIVRDIPVLREVAGDNAFYFSGREGSDMASALKEWLQLHQEGKTPDVQNLKWLTWHQSARQLEKVFLHGSWYKCI